MRTLFLILITAFVFPIGLLAQEVEHQHSLQHAFVENKGQWKDYVLFMSKTEMGNLWVEQSRFLFHMQDFSDTRAVHASEVKGDFQPEVRQRIIELYFVGSNQVSEIEKSHPTKAYYNYFIGNDQSKWARNVHGYGEAILHDFYDGVDMKLIENEYELKYEFHVQPHQDPSKIVMEYNGQDKIGLDRKGNLFLKTNLGEVVEQKPYVYQIVNGNIREVPCEFVLEGNQVRFKLGKYNPNATLIIDPILVFATYSGSPTDNFGMTATYGYDGTAYSGGIVFGNAYPTPAPAWNTTPTLTNLMPQANDPAGTYGVTDVFVSKYSSDGTQMLWTNFIGGGTDSQGTETVHSLICDTLNNLYLYGSTSSNDFPTQNAYANTHAGGVAPLNFTSNGVHHLTNGTDIYVSKLSADGMNLIGSTYIGGSGNDGVSYHSVVGAMDSLTTNYGDPFRGEIMLDESNNVIVASCTQSTDFPVLNAFQSTNGGMQDGVIFKLTSDLSTLMWSSYYGGSEKDALYSVKVDESGNVVFAGGTASTDLPNVATGWQTTYNGGKTDGFVTKISGDASTVLGGTYLGTPNYDQAFFVEVDRVNRIYVVGQSTNGAFPVVNTNYLNPNSSQFLVRLDSTLSTVLNSTQWGSGSNTIDISPSAFLVDICGNIYISGWGKTISGTAANNMPITTDAFQSTTNNTDFYLLVIERDFMDTLYATYIGGNQSSEHVDGGTSRFDEKGVVYQSVCGGCTGNSDFTTSPGAWSSTNDSDNCNNLIFKFDFELIPNAEFTIDNNIGCLPFTVNFDNFSSDSDSYMWDFGNGDTSTVIFEPVVTYDSVGTYQVYLYVTDSICLLTDTAEITITVYDSLELTTIPDQELCTTTAIDFTAFTNGTATSFQWSSNNNFTDTLNTDLSDSIWNHTPSGPMTYYIQASNDGCSVVDSVVVSFIGSALTLSGNDSLCLGETTTITATNSNPSITFTYDWGPDSVLVAPSSTNQVTVDPSVTQYITVTASSNTGCVVEDSIQIFVGNIPAGIVNATASDTLVAEGGTVTLIGEPGGYPIYEWTPQEGVVNPNAQSTEAVVDQPTVYTLTVSDGICARTDNVLVKTYGFICGDPYIYIPNAFSPNGDNENDILYVRGPLLEDMVFRVYDRWGELVFESYDRLIGWDGTFRGKPLDPDVYDYYLKATCVGGDEAIIKGNITLLK